MTGQKTRFLLLQAPEQEFEFAFEAWAAHSSSLSFQLSHQDQMRWSVWRREATFKKEILVKLLFSKGGPGKLRGKRDIPHWLGRCGPRLCQSLGVNELIGFSLPNHVDTRSVCPRTAWGWGMEPGLWTSHTLMWHWIHCRLAVCPWPCFLFFLVFFLRGGSQFCHLFLIKGVLIPYLKDIVKNTYVTAVADM